MHNTASTKFVRILFPLILVLVAAFLCFKNYTPGTYLIGWDSLHPEFNFNEAFNRAIFGVFRAEQGVGAVAIHSHMSDLPRIIFLFLESFFVPTSFLRYSYIFLCLILGPLGVYYFLNYCFRRERDGIEVYVGSFLGALYYLLNLGTMQHFYVPFEMFTTQFAFLPWLFLYALKILREGKRQNFVIFALLTIISSPQAYAATLFYAYFGALCLFVFSYFIMSRSKQTFKRGVGVISIVILLNLYWILPNIYSITTQSGVVINSKINQLFSPEATIRSQSFSDLSNVLINKSFLFDWRAFNYDSNKFTDLLQVWNIHLSQGYALMSIYIFATVSVLGLIFSVFKKDKVGISVFAVSLYGVFFLTGHNFGSKVFEEALRMPFTKFSIPLMFALAYFFGYFFLRLVSLFKGPFTRVFVGTAVILTISILLINSALPMFNGGLISPIVRRNFPKEYVQLFDWFKGKDGRIATLPLNTLWGWDYHSWNLPAGRQGYEGSGFLTYGLGNPLFVRDFDRWSAYNETFFNQASFALYANNPQAFLDTLKKNKVKYLVLDESIINAGSSNKLLYIDQIKKILESSQSIKKDQNFGFLSIYETNFDVNEVTAINKYTKINADLTHSQVDPIYSTVGDYVQTGSAIPSVKIASVGGVVKADLSLGGFKSGYNCDLEKVGTVSKKVVSGGVVYSSTNGGVECDFFEFPTLAHSQGLSLHIKGKNIAGRSLKIYLQNWVTNRIDLEELLPTGDFDKTFAILPKAEVTGKEVGYSLNLETRSFGKIASENIVEKIEFYPVDASYISKPTNITIDSLQEENLQASVGNNDLEILSVQKQGTWLYKVETTGSGLLELGQGYDQGWKAFPNFNYQLSVFNYQSIINFPIFNKELEHKKVSSWSNGWEVNSANCLNDNSLNTGNCKLIIVFWPQLLEWGGAILGMISLVFITSKRRNNIL